MATHIKALAKKTVDNNLITTRSCAYCSPVNLKETETKQRPMLYNQARQELTPRQLASGRVSGSFYIQ